MNLPDDSLAFNRFVEKYGYTFGHFINVDGVYRALNLTNMQKHGLSKEQFMNELEEE